MKCQKCGYSLPEDSTFCQYCGAQLPPQAPWQLNAHHAETFEAAAPPEISKKELTESQRYFDSDYGYSPDNPIVTSSVSMVGYYLYALRTEDGHGFTWERQPRRHGPMVDEYQLFVDGEPYKTIFFNPYGEDRDFTPSGLVRNPDAFSAAMQGITLEAYQANLAAEEQRKSLKKKKAKRARLIALSFVALVLLGLFLFFIGIPGVKYMHAKSLLRNGDYDGAYVAFSNLGSFGNAETMLLETRYQEAVALRNEKDFAAANKIFEWLGDYKDSKDLIHNHNFEESTIIVAVTCTTSGQVKHTCSCGEVYIEDIAATGHANKTVSFTPATCIEQGQEVLRCENCGEETTRTFPTSLHSYSSEITKAATCIATGEKKYTCSVCGRTYTQEIARTDHAYAGATCTKAKTCKTCGKTSGSALGHTNNAVCTRCGAVLFTTKSYSGYGPGNITGVTLPQGTYGIIFEHTGSRNFIVDFNSGYYPYDHLVVNEIGRVSLVYQLKVTSSSPVKNGYFNIRYADAAWTITIYAIE